MSIDAKVGNGIMKTDKKRSMAEALAGYGAYAWGVADLDVFYIGLSST